MRPVTRAFILAELLDVATTVFGLRLGFEELNPISWNWLVPLKVFVVLVGAVILQWVKPHKIYWIAPAFAGLIVVWNVLNIVLYYV